MQTDDRQSNTFLRGIAWFLLVPLVTLLVIIAASLWLMTSYESRHADRIYTGVTALGIDLGGLKPAEARSALDTAVIAANPQDIVLVDPSTGTEWHKTATDLGIHYDLDTIVDTAFNIGRSGSQVQQLREQAVSWYYGTPVPVAVIVDESYVDRVVEELAASIDRAPVDGSLQMVDGEVSSVATQFGRKLDKADARTRLMQPVTNLQRARVELLIHDVPPRIADAGVTAELVEQVVSSPVEFYFEKPVDGVDLQRVTLPPDLLVQWLQVDLVDGANGAEHVVSLDETAVRAWLEGYSAEIARDPVNARFYFDDDTRELVLIEPHINGRFLDIDATIAALQANFNGPNRSIPFVVQEVTPIVHSDATGEQLGIVELTSEATTYFYGSPPERMHNIAQAAANFYGIVVAPGELFSFNKYLGEISEEQGYTQGLIIVDGRTIEGIGGGVCQVSTTLFQTAFWAGLDIGDRYNHGYRVHYYEDGPIDGPGGVGMDATIFSPIVDLTFTNNTEHHLLIENYYREGDQSLTFKFYSTDIGRTVLREVTVENETDPAPDIWEYDPELPDGEIEQVDWAVGGADVTVHRIVLNQWGELRDEDYFISNYIPWSNIYKYGPGADVPAWVYDQ
ncbi:MAG: VanW family protein [Anaerolineae bacterium]|nr:VanW family protein [Anaerolineae bacterium]MCO5199619.1 VanW family protein [Anaerolineae bacterium]